MIEVKADGPGRWLGCASKGEEAVPSETFAVVVGVLVAFGGFAVLLAWADFYAGAKR